VSPPGTPNVGDTVSFNGSGSTDPVGLTYDWDFGDGGTHASGPTTSHTYTKPTGGDFTVTLTVTSTAADHATATASKVVHVNIPPTANFVYAVPNQFPAGVANRFPNQQSSVPAVGQWVAFAAGSAGGSKDPDGDINAASFAFDLDGNGSFETSIPANQKGSMVVKMPMPANAPQGQVLMVPVGLQVIDTGNAKPVTTTKTIQVDRPPAAGFTYSPSAPLTKKTIQLTSTSSDPDGAGDISSQSWDLNGDGKFGDASGTSVPVSFTSPGYYTVTLQVTDKEGVISTAQQILTVSDPNNPLPPPSSGGPGPSGSTSTPFKFTSPGTTSSGQSSAVAPKDRVIAGVRVAIAGSVSITGTMITRLLVTAPKGSIVKATCNGGGCPRKVERHHIGKHSVHLKLLQRRLKPGAKIGISITKTGFIGKYIRFTIRKGKAPLRTELCLSASGKRAGRCPA